jgi:hypothetical protein
VRINRRLALFGALGLVVLAFAGTISAAAPTRVVVTPANMQGWIIPPDNPPVPYHLNGPDDTDGGNGSFEFGPIAGVNAAKIELQPPENLFDVTTFDSLAFEYQILAPVGIGTSSDYVYVSVYVDSAANGLGFFGSAVGSTGFYDCRYTFVASSNAAGWNSMSFTGSTTPSASFFRHASCATTLGGNTGLLEFFRINGGDSSGNDNGMTAAYDLVEVSIGGSAKLYDFEPYLVATNKDQCKKNGWQSVYRDDGSSFKNQGDCIQYANTGK